MKKTMTEPAQYMERFGDKTVQGSVYAIKKLGLDRTRCSLKIENYTLPCVPFQLGFKHSILLVSVSKQELVFFQRYTNSSVVFSVALNPDHKPEPLNFFLRCSLNTIGQMKGRENIGLFIVEYKVSPGEMVNILGKFMEEQERIKAQYNDYSKTMIKMTPETVKQMGFNLYATSAEAGGEPRRIQLMGINSKSMEYLQAEGSPVLKPGTILNYHIFFKKYRVTAAGKINDAGILPQGLVRSVAELEFCPELVEIIDDYWYSRSKG
jgi:hypothetical protein